MPPSPICLFFSNTGGGHRSATRAIKAALNELLINYKLSDQFYVMSDSVVEKSHPINRLFVETYNFLLRHSQTTIKHYFNLIHACKPNDSPFGNWLTTPYLKYLVKQLKPAVVVSVHPMVNQYLPLVIKEAGATGKTKLITVVTDPNDKLWRGWASPGSDVTIVPNQLCSNKLISWGVPKEKILTIGMPIHPDFTRPARISKEDFRKQLGLMPEKFTLCINAGWAGGGNMVAVYKALAEVKKEIQVIFLSGHNRKLYEEITRLSRTIPVPTAVLPFYEQMSELMNAVDLMVTKAGGLTTFEAIARRLPIVLDLITEPMPQEIGNVEILLEAKLAKPLYTPVDIIPIVEKYDSTENRYANPLPKLYNLDRTAAAAEIAQVILEAALQSSNNTPSSRIQSLPSNEAVI